MARLQELEYTFTSSGDMDLVCGGVMLANFHVVNQDYSKAIEVIKVIRETEISLARIDDTSDVPAPYRRFKSITDSFCRKHHNPLVYISMLERYVPEIKEHYGCFLKGMDLQMREQCKSKYGIAALFPSWLFGSNLFNVVYAHCHYNAVPKAVQYEIMVTRRLSESERLDDKMYNGYGDLSIEYALFDPLVYACLIECVCLLELQDTSELVTAFHRFERRCLSISLPCRMTGYNLLGWCLGWYKIPCKQLIGFSSPSSLDHPPATPPFGI